jgi:hypothetical protein
MLVTLLCAFACAWPIPTPASAQNVIPAGAESSSIERPPVAVSVEDFAWMRGRFEGATLQEKAAWTELKQWADRCLATRTLEVGHSLRAADVEPVALPVSDYGQAECALVQATDSAAGHFASWDMFERSLAEAAPYFHGYRLAAEAAEETANGLRGDLPMALMMLTIGEQTLRKGLGSNIEGSHPLTMSDGARRLFDLMVWHEVKQRDLENSAILARLLDARGWPGISAVGQKASQSAWLVIQHADDDPALQWKALTLMEAAPEGEVDWSNYAYLYDRVMLKLRGTQRYGTQFTCVDRARVPSPLEDPAIVDQLRSAAGLPTLAEYSVTMNQRFGEVCE